MFVTNFKERVIDDNKTKNFSIFRLVESVSSIIIHERVKQELDKCNFKYLSFRQVSN